jgi:hypothetical protein
VKQLLELASEHISYWEGEGIGSAIEFAVEHENYSLLEKLLKDSAKQIFINEFRPDNYVTDNQLERMGKDYERADTF